MELSLSNNILLEATPVNLKNHQCFRDNENFCGLENNVIQQVFYTVEHMCVCVYVCINT